MIKHGMGCIKPAYDRRDYQFADLISGVQKKDFPVEYIPSNYHVFDQADTQMCCACAIAGSRYIYELRDSGNEKLFSPGYIYGNRFESSVLDGVYEGEGMYLKDAMKQLIQKGICYYDTHNMISLYSFCKSYYQHNMEKMDTEAHPFRISSYYAVNTTSEIKRAIMETGSVICSFLVTSGWFGVKKDGIIPVTGNIEGGHAVLIVGWKIIDGKEYWIILNSWGTEWGDHGFGYVEKDETKMMLEAYCLIDEIKEVYFKQMSKGASR